VCTRGDLRCYTDDAGAEAEGYAFEEGEADFGAGGVEGWRRHIGLEVGGCTYIT